MNRKSAKLVLGIGVALFVIGSGPLLVTILLANLGLTRDPNPNPIGFGLLAFLTFWPSILLMVIGGWQLRKAP